MEDTITLKQKVDELYDENQQKKTKKFKVPRKGKVSKRQQKKGFTTIMRIDNNGNVDFEKKQIDGATYRLSTREYHATNEADILSYKGKPFIIQPTKKLNPYNPLSGKNETYGQPYIMARMLGDTIKVKSAKGNILIWILIVGAVLFGINYFMGG